ncbi:MAG: YggS family pyridoxal phosphate-dependent enzyme [Alphaproteobacteria bacterium]|nr:YggS family pyridoxal phosphate-dependent enzyme [Alphaproteobacteria bacterium]
MTLSFVTVIFIIMTIAETLTRIRASIPPRVTLIAVSKTVEETRLREAIAAGQRVFGENYVQESKAKWPALKAEFPDVQLHLIGHLQSNKAEDAVKLFDRIDTLDRPSLAEALGKAMWKRGRNIPCLIEVNIGDEPQKAGCAIADMPALLALCKTLDIQILGVMCIPPEGSDPVPYFKKLVELAAQYSLKIISMGMSGDYEVAIAHGATEVRIGSAIFGARQPK